MSRWRSWTWPRVQASVCARPKALWSWCMSIRSSSASREGATTVQYAMRAEVPGAIRTRWRRANTGSRTVPTVFERVPEIAAAVEAPRLRPMNRARSVSYCCTPTVLPSTTAKCATQIGGSSGDRGRRVAISAPYSGRYSVWTKSLAKAGCAASEAGVVRTSSSKRPASISRGRRPVLVSVTRRTSPSSSPDTRTSSVVVSVPSRRMNSARSSVNWTSV